MRRRFIFSLALAMTFTLAMLGSGCGGDAGKARDYISQGNELVASIEKKGEELGGTMNQAFEELYADISSGKAPDVQAFDSATEGVDAMAEDMVSQAREARSFFEKVDALEDVPGYKKYADLKVEIIDMNIKGLEDLKSFLAEARAMLTAADFDMVAFQSFVTAYGEAVQKLGDEGGAIQEQAEKVKKEKKL